MKKVQYLAEALGEYSYTDYYIKEPYYGQEYDKELMHPCIFSADDWRPYSIPKYKVITIEIPEWMEDNEYDSHQWKWYVKIGGNEELGKKVYEKITKIENGALRLACIKLLKTKSFKSEFRKSLKEQLLNWLENSNDYSTPFSLKQQQYLLNPFLLDEAKRIGVY